MNIGNKIKELRKQRGITQEQLANSIGISFQAVSKWENGIALPDNEVLLNNLLYVLNYTKDPDETISIASSLIEKTNQADIKYDALRFLSYAYKVKGDLKSAEAAIEQIPEIYFTKLTEMAYLLEGKPKYEAAEKQKWISFENLIQMMEKLAEYYESEGMKAEAIKEREKALKFIDLVEDSAFDVYVSFFNNKIKNNLE